MFLGVFNTSRRLPSVKRSQFSTVPYRFVSRTIKETKAKTPQVLLCDHRAVSNPPNMLLDSESYKYIDIVIAFGSGTRRDMRDAYPATKDACSGE